ncbi:MAG TPA: phosphoribosylamine--glycine ligase [Gemmatimonadaceae bacterium]|nr:phosphoribosylamine--glycine ligase [Gemmatimonadaceae bacterium]
MKVLLVGGGAREHALAWKLMHDDPSLELLVAPGNPGIAELGRCTAIKAMDLAALVDLARAERPDLTIVGPEAPLAAGLADALREHGVPVFGPGAAAARIESSKTFAKQLMLDAGVPTARAERHVRPGDAKRAARSLGAPLVIKASGLAAGKGVLIARTLGEADRAIDEMLVGHSFGEAGNEILVEEFMDGEELSLFVLTDGTRVVPMLPAQDHKRLLAGDTGPNTGGMGAYAPLSLATPALVDEIIQRIVRPTLRAMRAAGSAFSGLLYAGIMVTPDGTSPRVVEFNCRFGDPETEALLPLLAEPLLPRLLGVASGEADESPLRWTGRHAVTTVVAASGYPDTPRLGDAITLPSSAGADVHVFHAGTARASHGRLVTAGGRVFAVTAVADTLAGAQRSSVRTASAIEFAGSQYRADIAWRELERHAGAA